MISYGGIDFYYNMCQKKKKNFYQNPVGRLAIADVEVQGLQL